MVMFHHEIPYALALERGRVQAAILAQLTADADTIAAIDPARMDALVHERLEPLPHPHATAV
jgi:kynurenine 3-monooxygenase